MKVICIDGKSKNPDNPFNLPEYVPLEVSQSNKYHECYIVNGYYIVPETNIRIHWGKRRFIPLSEIDETEMIRESVHQYL